MGTDRKGSWSADLEVDAGTNHDPRQRGGVQSAFKGKLQAALAVLVDSRQAECTGM